ncbi:putative uncharacterized protein DDB_G0288537 [Anopheles aquasalis]|uniref:putative uncharacterized protein DDB_G0288537 n=1 Tax=Anopheles aquasalis TaxID=42839 RepID=UPI00215B0394|nr:putative uncharacterized protein DDB_G0288537 [Anopheles aquasalis]
MSSPADNGSCHGNDNPPLYHSTERMMPLGFSTPQQNRSETRNYYSAQPKHMLPRSRGGGYQNRNRFGQTQQHSNQDRSSFSPMDNAGEQQAGQNYGRNWRGQHQNRHQNYSGQRRHQNHHQHHQKTTIYRIEDYLHPSMLEDPWEYLSRKGHKNDKDTAEADPTLDGLK